MPVTSHGHPIETPVRRTPLKIGTTTATESVERELLSVSWLRLGKDPLVAGGGWSSGVGAGEQAGFGFGFDEDAPADQAFQFGADAFGVLREDRQVEGLAEVAGAHRPARVGQGGEDLLVGGVVRDVGAVRPGGG